MAIDISASQRQPVRGMDNFTRSHSNAVFTPFISKRVNAALVASKRLVKPRA